MEKIDHSEHTEKLDKFMKDEALEKAWKNEKKEKVAITLSPKIKEETLKLLRRNGGKLSPLLDSLLVSWIYRQRLIQKMMKKIENGEVLDEHFNKKNGGSDINPEG